MAKPKFSEEICECLVENYGNGIPLKYCADSVGIARSTLYYWMDKGKNAKSGKYRKFYLEMQRAKSKFISHHMQKISESKNWQASQYLLQVTDTEQFIVKEKREIEANANIKTELIKQLERPLPELEDDDD
jgi:hypothetical protein